MNQTGTAESTCVVVAEKNIVASCAEDFRKKLQEAMDTGCHELIVDLKNVDIVDSRGMALFMLCHNSLSQAGRRLRVVTQNPDLQHLFHVMRLDQHFTVSEQL